MLQRYIEERETITNSRVRNHASVTFDTPYTTTIKKDMEFILDDVQYAVTKKYDNNDTDVICVVVESDVSDIIVGSEQSFDVARAHSLIISYLRTL